MGSKNLARIKVQVLDVVGRIPLGKLTTFAAIGAELDVPARHVAYILATLDQGERARVPWQRVVAENGGLGSGRQGSERATLLAGEGVALRQGRALDLSERLIEVPLDADNRLDPETPLARSPED